MFTTKNQEGCKDTNSSTAAILNYTLINDYKVDQAIDASFIAVTTDDHNEQDSSSSTAQTSDDDIKEFVIVDAGTIEDDFVTVQDAKRTTPLDTLPFTLLEKCDLALINITDPATTVKKAAHDAEKLVRDEKERTPLLLKKNGKFYVYGYRNQNWQEIELKNLSEKELALLNNLDFNDKVIKKKYISDELLDILKNGHDQLEWITRHNDHKNKSAHTVIKMNLKKTDGSTELYYVKLTIPNGKNVHDYDLPPDPLPDFEAGAGAVQHFISRRWVAKTILFTNKYGDSVAIGSKAIANFSPNKNDPLTKQNLTFELHNKIIATQKTQEETTQKIYDIEVELPNQEYDEHKSNLKYSLEKIKLLCNRDPSGSGYISWGYRTVANLVNSFSGDTAISIEPKIASFLEDTNFTPKKYSDLRELLNARLNHKDVKKSCSLYVSTQENIPNIQRPAYVYNYKTDKLTYYKTIKKIKDETPLMLVPTKNPKELPNVINKITNSCKEDKTYQLTMEQWADLDNIAGSAENSIECVELYRAINEIDQMLKCPPKKIPNPELVEKLEKLDSRQRETHFEKKEGEAGANGRIGHNSDPAFTISDHDYLAYRYQLSAAVIRLIKAYIAENDDHNGNFGKEGMFDFDHSIGPISFPLHIIVGIIKSALELRLRSPKPNTHKLATDQWSKFPDSDVAKPFYSPCKEAFTGRSSLSTLEDSSEIVKNWLKNCYTEADHEVFKSLPLYPFFVYYKNLYALRILLIDPKIFAKLLEFNIRKNWKLIGEIYKDLKARMAPEEQSTITEDSLIAITAQWLANRTEELKQVLTRSPEFRDFLLYSANIDKQGDLVMKKIMEEFNEDREELTKELKNKKHYADLISLINDEEIKKNFVEIYHTTMKNAAEYEQQQKTGFKTSGHAASLPSLGLLSSSRSTPSTPRSTASSTSSLSTSTSPETGGHTVIAMKLTGSGTN